MDAAAAARERRKARLANGADRLSKITGKPVDESQLPKARQASPAAPSEPKPDAPSEKPIAAASSVVHDTDDPPDVLPGDIPSALNAATLPGSSEGANNGSNPLAGDLWGSMAGQAAQTEAKGSSINWSTLHYFTMVLVGLYACWNEYSLWKLFVGVEVAMLSAKYALDPSQEPGILRTIIQFVPPQYGSKLKVPLFAIQAARTAYNDLCVVLFVWAGTAAFSTFI